MNRRHEIDFSLEIRKALAEEEGNEELISEEIWAEEKTKGKKLNKPFRTPGGPKKFSVYVKNEKGNVVKVNFGDPNMEIKRDSPERRKSFRARHNCANPGPKTKARYWSCKMWNKKSVTNVTKGNTELTQEMLDHLDESEAELSEKQKKLPPEMQKKILKKQGKDPKKSEKDSPKEESEAERKGLWHNIREKKKREGKNYKPAKPGDKDRPDPEAYKKAQKKKKEAKAEHGQKEGEKFKPHKMYDKNGKAYDAKTYEDHLRMRKMGYTHENPKIKSESGYKKKKKY